MPVDPKRVNRCLGAFIPGFELLIFIYAAYVVTGEIAVNWLLRPPPDSSHSARPGAAIAVLVIFYLLLLPCLASLARIVLAICIDPGFVALPSEVSASDRSKKGRKRRRRKSRGGDGNDGGDSSNNAAGDAPVVENGGLQGMTNFNNNNGDVELGTMGLQASGYGNINSRLVPAEIYEKDAFVCNPTGRPWWCDKCKTWKPDRTHHSSDVGRCVRALDHYCPWAGGVVGEANHKFFNQFVTYTALLCIMVTIVCAVVVAEQRRDGISSGHTFLTTVVLLPFAVFFGLFTSAMSGVHIGYALKNITTIEELQLKSQAFVAIHVGLPGEFPSAGRDIIVYPEPESGQAPRRGFIVIRADPGTNIYDLGPWRNWQQLMGKNVWDWFLPIRHGTRNPLGNAYPLDSDYPFWEQVMATKKQFDELRQRGGGQA